MEETATWKGHSFTLLIFGGIVVLCSIFFVLGMLVGRSQGQRIAEMALANKSARNAQVQSAEDDFKLDYFAETTEEKPDLKLEPAPEPPPAPAAKTPEAAAKAPARSPAVAPKPAAKPASAPSGTYLQVFATRNSKQAASELKRVQSKGFKARIVTFEQNKAEWHRVYVGPYKDSEVSLARSDLKAKGFKDVIVRK